MLKFNLKPNFKKPNLKLNFKSNQNRNSKTPLKEALWSILNAFGEIVKKRNLRIGARINLIVFFLCIAALIIGVLGLRTSSKINEDLDTIYYKNLLVLKALGDAKTDFQSQRVTIYDYVLTDDPGQLITLEITAVNLMNNFEDDLKIIENGGLNEKDKEILNSIKTPLEEYKSIMEKVFDTYSQESTENRNIAIDIVHNEVASAVSNIETYLNILMATQVRLAEDTKKAANAQFQETRNLMTIIIILSIAIALILGIILSRSISKPIKTVVNHAEIIAGGDFTNAVPEKLLKRKDEIGALAIGFKDMQSQLNDLIRTIMGSAENLAAATQQMSASTEQITGGAQEQSDQIQQVSDNIQNVAATAKKVTEKAQGAWDIAYKAKETSQTGQTYIENVRTGMKTIDDTMVKLSGNSAKIGEIVDVISEIADQTNLLSLNAAIEAARAGEHGRGFAVVADEVRKLAERSAKATKEIVNIIATIKKDTEDAVKASNKGEQIAVEANQAFGAIHNLITSNADMVNEIVAAIEQVENGVEQVSAAAEAISAVTEEAAAGLEEISASAGDMSNMADNLQTIVQKFKIVQ
ncbi:MAG: methyl-accepting chemotaxis protein [Dehalobacterium sp.]